MCEVGRLRQLLKVRTDEADRLISEKSELMKSNIELRETIEALEKRLDEHSTVWNVKHLEKELAIARDANEMLKAKNDHRAKEVEYVTGVCSKLGEENSRLIKEKNDLKRKCEAFENAEPTYVKISGMRAGSMILKITGENNRLRKDLEKTRDELKLALSELNKKGCELLTMQEKLYAVTMGCTRCWLCQRS
jgi:hypothetical protein